MELRADSIRLPLLRLAREGSRLIHASTDDVEFRCSAADSSSQIAADVAFLSSESYVVSSWGVGLESFQI